MRRKKMGIGWEGWVLEGGLTRAAFDRLRAGSARTVGSEVGSILTGWVARGLGCSRIVGCSWVPAFAGMTLWWVRWVLGGVVRHGPPKTAARLTTNGGKSGLVARKRPV